MTLLLENPQPNHRRTSQAHKKQPSFAHQFQLNYPEFLVISFSKRRSSLAAFNPKKMCLDFAVLDFPHAAVESAPNLPL